MMKKIILLILLALPFISYTQVKWTHKCEQIEDGDKNHILFQITFTATISPGYYIYSQHVGNDSLMTKIFKYKTSRLHEKEVITIYGEEGISAKKGIWKVYKNKVSFTTWLDLNSINTGVAGYRIDYRVGNGRKDQIKQEIVDIYPQLKKL